MSGVLDLSTEDGRPILLYEFTRTSVPTISGVPVTLVYRYTSADADYVYPGNGFTYKSIAMDDDGIRQTSDPRNDDLTVSMPSTELIPQMFAISSPSDVITVILRQTHLAQADAFISWAGQIAAVTRGRDAVTAQINCVANSATMSRGGLRLSWTRSCPHDLYGFRCKAPATSNYIAGTVTAVDSQAVQVTGFDAIGPGDGGFLGGFIEWLTPDGFAERRGIIEQNFGTPDKVRVMGVIHGLNIGDTVWGFRGCNRTTADCISFFGNLGNYGGFEFLPGKNVFTGETIF